MIGVPYSSDFKSDWFSLDGTIKERLICRNPTADEYAAYQVALVRSRRNGKPGDEPVDNYTAFLEATSAAVIPLITSYEVDGADVPPNWREELPGDWRYREVLSAIGQILFRQATFVRPE